MIVTFHVAETSNAEERAVAIVNGREALLQTIPAATYRVVRAYATVAAVVLEVSASALKVLEKSPRVVSIEKDSPDAPQ